MHQARAVFVAGALPGERVRARVQEVGRVLRGELLEVLEASPVRRVPDACPLADRCGGCDWLNLDEDAQLSAKKEIVLSALEHLGGIPRTAYEAKGIQAVAPAMGYRRRAVLHPGKEGLGYFGRRSHTHVQVDRCPALVREAQGMPGELAQALQPILRDISEVHVLEAGGKTVVLAGWEKQQIGMVFSEPAQNRLGVPGSDVRVRNDGVAVGWGYLACNRPDLTQQAGCNPDRATERALIYQVTSPAPVRTFATRASMKRRSESRFR